MRRTKRKWLLPVIDIRMNTNVMPFGLANAPGIFYKLMSIVLYGLGNFAMAYLDDTSKPYILCTDASDDCIGVCLCQVQDT